MKNYLPYLLLIACIISYGQNSKSTDIYSSLNSVSSNVESGINVFHIKDLKYHAQKSLEAITNVKNNLEESKCLKTLELCDKMIENYNSALRISQLIDGKMYLNNTKDLITQTFYQYEVCTNKSNSENANNALSDLEKQQSSLRQQQLELEQKTKEINRQLALQKEQEQLLKRKKLINLNEEALSTNINAYNKLLKACDCNKKVTNSTENIPSLTTKTAIEIKTHYLNKIKKITENYLNILNNCSI